MNSQTSIHKPQSSGAVQWRFAMLYLLFSGPVLAWPLVVHSNHYALVCALVWAPLLTVHILVPVLDRIFPLDLSPPLQGQTHWINRLLPALCLPVWLLTLGVSLWSFRQGLFPGLVNASSLEIAFPFLGCVLSLGAIGGAMAINPAHELIHRKSLWERNCGGILLAAVSYGAFKIEHVRGHHLHVGTSKDTASARLGQNTFSFAVQSFFGTLLGSARLEAQRLAKAPFVEKLFRNEWLRLYALTALFATLSFLIAGGLGLLLFFGASLGAIFQLEVINFIEHYGLSRGIDPKTGKMEAVRIDHSWNTSTFAGNIFLFNLQRHSDHHAHAGKDYLHLAHEPNAPQLPYGYGQMFLIALVPPLWRKVMDPLVLSLSHSRK